MSQRVYLIRPATQGEWLVCTSTAQLQQQIDEIGDEDDVAEIEIRVKSMTPAEIEALPEFGGW